MASQYSPEYLIALRFKTMIETTVLGGFPVIAAAVVLPADEYCPTKYTEEFELFTLTGKPASFLEKRMSPREVDAVTDRIIQSLQTSY